MKPRKTDEEAIRRVARVGVVAVHAAGVLQRQLADLPLDAADRVNQE